MVIFEITITWLSHIVEALNYITHALLNLLLLIPHALLFGLNVLNWLAFKFLLASEIDFIINNLNDTISYLIAPENFDEIFKLNVGILIWIFILCILRFDSSNDFLGKLMIRGKANSYQCSDQFFLAERALSISIPGQKQFLGYHLLLLLKCLAARICLTKWFMIVFILYSKLFIVSVDHVFLYLRGCQRLSFLCPLFCICFIQKELWAKLFDFITKSCLQLDHIFYFMVF